MEQEQPRVKEAIHRPFRGRILLTGASGQVGSELRRTLAPLGDLVAPSRADLDMADADSVRRCIRRLHPRWIVNAAAYTAVDKAETEPALAFAVNTAAVAAIGEEAQTIGAAVIHLSTDYVFDGESPVPYRETDIPRPLNVYGESKLAGEAALEKSGAAHMIFRTGWVFGSSGKNFLLTILSLARARERLRVVADQHGAPTWSRDLARLIAHAIACCEANADGASIAPSLATLGGIYHATGAGATTWHGFAEEAVRVSARRDPNTRFAAVDPITTAEYPTPARRPANSRLDCARLRERLDWTMMDWHTSLAQVVSEL